MKTFVLSTLLALLLACGDRKPGQQPQLEQNIKGLLTKNDALSADINMKIDNQSKQQRESYVDRHGLLRVRNGQIVDASEQSVQLKGMSLFWSQWSGAFWNKDAVATIARDWRATVVRAAMGVEMGGYLSNPNGEKARIKEIVEAAMQEGIYVIIDWHDHNAHQHRQSAVEFFTEMAMLYGNNPHVVFEVFNEPIDISWEEVKSYAEAVIAAIRAKGAQNLVIVGSPSWSQRVDLAANNPIRDSNVAYTLHYYAATHRQDLRNKASYALSKGLALFVTEFGVCEASGDGRIDYGESWQWFNFLDRHRIGWANWSLNDKPEAASALRPGANPRGGWTDADLTASGKFIRDRMRQ